VNVTIFSEAVDVYINRIKITGRCSKAYLDRVKALRRTFGHLSLGALPDALDEWQQERISKGYNGKSFAGPSLNRPIEIVAAIYNQLVALDVIPKNPITRIRYPRFRERPRDRYLTADERTRLFEAIKRVRPCLLPIIKYMLLVPCRSGELMSARREQYNPFTNTIYIPDSKAKIPMHKPVPEEMLVYFETIPVECPWLFWWLDKVGNFRQWKCLDTWWWRCREVAGLSDVRIHDLRHIAATDLYEAGNSERAIRAVAGWKTNMLDNYYHKDGLRSAQTIVFKPVVF